MKRQSGFTLIELLLVLAIIGIISAIAIPALLSQRARARDKTAISNMEGRVGDLIGQYDRYREMGLTSSQITTSLGNYLAQTGGSDKNPWNGSQQAFDSAVNAA
ncbi:MAG: prepilin-type N-terminal cleavage/methylation domain-containing protein, partial [Holophaga sp.]|nr:prepilin-type N-terminal cleavage/methylation domain-containing protein [Holophaga sp.]